MSDWKELDAFISKADEILIVSHQYPDGDAIASTLIVSSILKSMNKKGVMVNHSPVPDRYRFLKDSECILQPHEVSATFRYVIIVDCGDLDRVGEASSLFSEEVKIVNIDHHKTNHHFGTINVVDSSVAATVQLLYEWIRFLKLAIDPTLAEMIYTGLVTDTGGFKYANTSSYVLRIAADLLDTGIKPHQITYEALDSMTPEYLKLLQLSLSSLTLSEEGRVAWMSLPYKDLSSCSSLDLEGIVQYTRHVIGVEVGVLFKEVDKHHIKISFRSKNFFDVAAFAQQFQGGGHERASGCSIKGPLDKVQKDVIEKLKEALEKKHNESL